VVDHQGALVLALRLDGTKRTCLTMARSKAETAVTATEQTDYLVHPDCLTSFSGCLPIHVGGRLAGGVGVSGAQPEVDERVARAGLSVLASF
jgi:glc operon protein GlcG